MREITHKTKNRTSEQKLTVHENEIKESNRSKRKKGYKKEKNLEDP